MKLSRINNLFLIQYNPTEWRIGMKILSKIVKVSMTIAGAVAGTKVSKEVGLNQTHGAIGGALLGYGSGSVIVDATRTAVKGAKMAKAIAEELKAAKAAEALEAAEAPTEETAEEMGEAVE